MDIPAAPLDPEACYRALKARDPRFDGRFFTCVLTTGIYCRPVCPARTPKRENVRFAESAAAAEARGFRPCLRCRPETAPDMGAWRGSSSTVSRALAQIEDGALDEGDVERLAGRLGVGGRHLRRLFRQHLGASPVAVAQTRRVLLARALLHDSDLSMACVALAAGFGSVRRFNETFLALHGRPPSELRRRRVTTGAAAGGVRLGLPLREPYDAAQVLSDLAIAGETVERGVWHRALVPDDGAEGWLEARLAPGRLDLRASVSDLRVLPRLLARVRRLFDLSADPDIISRDLSADPRLRDLVARCPGLRVVGRWVGVPAAPLIAPESRIPDSWRPWEAYALRHLREASGEDTMPLKAGAASC
ncbi:MAG: bifunctional transcriptional activator/DNA repair enzyme AdaA [Brevundimonas sp.]|uniref:bifunctional transcriptional activator/DNA repair enzyme AdaA n=2 Tax=Brevundimonas sp. TaxID=1871086 RepID=UPI00391902D7